MQSIKASINSLLLYTLTVLVLPGLHSEGVDQVTLIADLLFSVKGQVKMIIKLRWPFIQNYVQMTKSRLNNEIFCRARILVQSSPSIVDRKNLTWKSLCSTHVGKCFDSRRQWRHWCFTIHWSFGTQNRRLGIKITFIQNFMGRRVEWFENFIYAIWILFNTQYLE